MEQGAQAAVERKKVGMVVPPPFLLIGLVVRSFTSESCCLKNAISRRCTERRIANTRTESVDGCKRDA